MRVVHISSSDSGGAGIAARRLNDALNDAGIDSKLLCVHKTTRNRNIVKYDVPITAKLLTHSHIPIGQNKYLNHLSKYEDAYEAVSFPESFFDISEHPLVKQADIINLHWVGSILNYKLFFSRVKRPIVWTLHDMNPFLGIAHYMGDLNKNDQFREIEKKVCRLKNQAISRHPQVHVVNLCDWMRQYSAHSQAFSNRDHSIIPNSINTNLFKYRDKLACRKILDINPKDRVLLFCAQSVHNQRKGFDLLLNALDRIRKDVVLAIIGDVDGLTFTRHSRCRLFGSINNELMMSVIYSAADLFVLPSREDNLPNTMVESLCCGTPVISFSNGGMKNVIDDNFSGKLVTEQSSEALSDAINEMFSSTTTMDSQSISRHAANMFSPTKQAQEYISLYNDLMKRAI